MYCKDELSQIHLTTSLICDMRRRYVQASRAASGHLPSTAGIKPCLQVLHQSPRAAVVVIKGELRGTQEILLIVRDCLIMCFMRSILAR